MTSFDTCGQCETVTETTCYTFAKGPVKYMEVCGGCGHADYVMRDLAWAALVVNKRLSYETAVDIAQKHVAPPDECHVCEPRCEGETDLECFGCGQPACSNEDCVKVIDWFKWGKQRICVRCIEDHDVDTALNDEVDGVRYGRLMV